MPIVFFQYRRHTLIAAIMPPDLPLDIVPLILQHLCKKPLSKEWHPFQQAEDPFSSGDLPDEGQPSNKCDVSWKYDLFSFSLCSHAMRRAALPFIFESIRYRFKSIWHKYTLTLNIAIERDPSSPSVPSTPTRPKGLELPALQDLYEFMAITPHIAGVVKNLQLYYTAKPCYRHNEDTPGQEREKNLHHIDIRDLGKFLDLFGCLRSLELLGIPIDVPQSYHVLETRGRAIDRLSFDSSHQCTFPPTISIQPYLAPLLLFDKIKKLVLDYPSQIHRLAPTDRPPVYFPFPGESLVVMCSPGLVGSVLERLADTDASRTETHLRFLKVCELTHSDLRPLNKLLSRFGANLVELELDWTSDYGSQVLAPDDNFKLLSHCKNLRVVSIVMFDLSVPHDLDRAPQERYNIVAHGLACLLSSCGATSIDLMLEIPWELLAALQDVLLDLNKRGVLRSVYVLPVEAREAFSQQIRQSELDKFTDILDTSGIFAPLRESTQRIAAKALGVGLASGATRIL